MEELKNAYSKPEWQKWIEEKGATFKDTDATTDFMSARDLYYSREPRGTLVTNKEEKKTCTVTWLCEHPRSAIISCYLSKLLKAGEFWGTYEIQNTGTTMDFVTINFRKTESKCPGCGSSHPDYNFQYKVRIGKYGGWKCWKSDAWQTHYDLEMMNRIFSQ